LLFPSEGPAPEAEEKTFLEVRDSSSSPADVKDSPQEVVVETPKKSGNESLHTSRAKNLEVRDSSSSPADVRIVQTTKKSGKEGHQQVAEAKEAGEGSDSLCACGAPQPKLKCSRCARRGTHAALLALLVQKYLNRQLTQRRVCQRVVLLQAVPKRRLESAQT
jgi:hypothetical protein